MIAGKALDAEAHAITSTTYKGTTVPVTGVTLRPLTMEGRDADGKPTFSMRMVSVEPGCELPLHAHPYLQSVYVQCGVFECWTCDPETDEVLETVVCGPGDWCHNPGDEPHGMRNVGDETAVFICAIGYPKE
jgi:quercetin dioxygenase-like cupin family protein